MSNEFSYDDVFRTEAEKMPRLFVPFINWVFGTNYDSNVSVRLLSDHHHVKKLNKPEEKRDSGKRITDCLFEIEGNQYHFELQSSADGSMIIRMLEYDLAIALEKMMHGDFRDELEIELPKSSVIYLREAKITPDFYRIYFVGEQGRLEHRIPVIKLQQLSLENLTQAELLPLFPFIILKYEKEIEKGGSLDDMQRDLAFLHKRFLEMREQGVMNEAECRRMMESTILVMQHVMRKSNECERMVKVMSGRILELPTDKLIRESREEVIISLLRKGKIDKETATETLGITETELDELLGDSVGTDTMNLF